jgi:hypothetical protein
MQTNSNWNDVELKMLEQMKAEQTKRREEGAARKVAFKTGASIDISLFTNIACPACNGKGEARVEDTDGTVRTVGLYCCTEVRCACCSGTGKLPKAALAAILAAA